MDSWERARVWERTFFPRWIGIFVLFFIINLTEFSTLKSFFGAIFETFFLFFCILGSSGPDGV